MSVMRNASRLRVLRATRGHSIRTALHTVWRGSNAARIEKRGRRGVRHHGLWGRRERALEDFYRRRISHRHDTCWKPRGWSRRLGEECVGASAWMDAGDLLGREGVGAASASLMFDAERLRKVRTFRPSKNSGECVTEFYSIRIRAPTCPFNPDNMCVILTWAASSPS